MSTGHLENFSNEALIDDILLSYRQDYDLQTDWDDLAHSGPKLEVPVREETRRRSYVTRRPFYQLLIAGDLRFSSARSAKTFSSTSSERIQAAPCCFNSDVSTWSSTPQNTPSEHYRRFCRNTDPTGRACPLSWQNDLTPNDFAQKHRHFG